VFTIKIPLENTRASADQPAPRYPAAQ
jgi:hypothetical protein